MSNAVTCTSEEVDEWQRFPYLNSGYRKCGSYSVKSCLASMFHLHNETVNIWTMIVSSLLGTFGFVMCMVFLAPRGVDASPFAVMWVAQMLHSVASVCYHTFMCMSPVVANTWRKTDISLIFVLNVGATYGLTYFTWGLKGALTAMAASVVPASYGIMNTLRLQPGQPVDRGRIVSMIGVTNVGYYVPLLYNGVVTPFPDLAIALIVLACHALGGIAYAKHWPQRNYPNKFDLCGFSHNIMHVLCFAAWNLCWPYLWYRFEYTSC